MSSLAKTLLLPAAIAASPLLIAAGQLPNLESMPLICEAGGSNSEASDHDSSNSDDNQLGYVVQPISSAPRAIVTSEQEWLSIDRETTTAVEDSTQDYCINKEEPGTTTTEGATETPTGELPNLGSDDVNAGTAAPTQQPAPLPSSTPPEVTPAATDVDTVEDFASPEPPPLVERQTPPPPSDPGLDPSNFTPEGSVPTPFDGIVEPTLESLPDGSYRYLSGNFEYGNYTDQQIINNGGSIFLLTKVGENIVGDLRPRLGLPGICITGTVSDDTVLGSAYPHEETVVEVESSDIGSQTEGTTESSETDEKESTREVEDTVEPYGSGALQIRQSRIIEGQLYYQEAVLDLSNFSRINAGSALAPTECSEPSLESESFE